MNHVRKPVLLLFLALASSACAPYVVVKHAPEAGRIRRVAVLPFKDAPGAPGSGAVAYTAFNNSLLSLPGYELVERGSVDEAELPVVSVALATLGAGLHRPGNLP